MRNNRTSKQLVVQRLLPLQPGMPQNIGVVTPANDIKYGSVKLDNTIRKQLRVETETSPKAANETNYVINQKSGSLDMSKLLEIDDEPEEVCDKKPENDEIKVSNVAPDQSAVLTLPDIQLQTNSDLESVEPNVEEENEEDRIRRHLDEDPGIQSLMEISLPSPIPIIPAPEECMCL